MYERFHGLQNLCADRWRPLHVACHKERVWTSSTINTTLIATSLCDAPLPVHMMDSKLFSLHLERWPSLLSQSISQRRLAHPDGHELACSWSVLEACLHGLSACPKHSSGRRHPKPLLFELVGVECLDHPAIGVGTLYGSRWALCNGACLSGSRTLLLSCAWLLLTRGS